MTPITITLGQMVDWPPAPDRVAQVDELRRSCVRLVYRTKSGRLRRPIVRAARLAIGQTFLPGVTNAMNRGVLPRSKQYPPPKSECPTMKIDQQIRRAA
jgi:hypothetical protein